MSGPISSQSNFGSFVPTTNVWDIQQLQDLPIDPGLKELLVRLYQNINNIAVSLNTRDAGYYFTQEFINGQIYFPDPNLNSSTIQNPINRQVYRTVVNCEALPNTTTISVPHNVDVVDGYSFTRIYGTATDPIGLTFIPIPYASATLINNIELSIDQTNVNITTGIDYSSYTTTYVVLEYIKS